MRFLYNIIIHLYGFSAGIASLFNKKAKLWKEGRKDVFSFIEKRLYEEDPLKQRKRIWFHCASLGEFEQGRPVIEAYHAKYPDHMIIVTFFSPSGYEIRKNYKGASLVCYLPSDTPGNAEKFVELTNPDIAIFIKYEFWFNYLRELRKRKKKIYYISVIFRPSQIFYRWYGAWFRKQLSSVTWFFTQDKTSLDLIKAAGLENGSVSGDTRFDRVYSISQAPKDIEVLRIMCGSEKVFILGSTWPDDEKILLSTVNQQGMKIIIAPHEIHQERVNSLRAQIKRPVMFLSEMTPENASSADVAIVDSIGLLSSIYRYGDIAYIGGGFGVGIHNILEAAAFGIPVIFGPNHKKFREALDLIALGGAWSVENEPQLVRILDNFRKNGTDGKICSKYVYDNQGATSRIMDVL